MAAHKGSSSEKLAQMQVGDVLWIETTQDSYPLTMRAYNLAKSRRPPEIKLFEFTTSLFTALSRRAALDIRHLVRVERTK